MIGERDLVKYITLHFQYLMVIYFYYTTTIIQLSRFEGELYQNVILLYEKIFISSAKSNLLELEKCILNLFMNNKNNKGAK